MISGRGADTVVPLVGGRAPDGSAGPWRTVCAGPSAWSLHPRRARPGTTEGPSIGTLWQAVPEVLERSEITELQSIWHEQLEILAKELW